MAANNTCSSSCKFKTAFTHWDLLTSTFHLQSLLLLHNINILNQGLRLYGCPLAIPEHLSSTQYVDLVAFLLNSVLMQVLGMCYLHGYINITIITII